MAVLGWLLLDLLGWRVFILLTSVPLFLPPIAILHCCSEVIEISDSSKPGSDVNQSCEPRSDPNQTQEVIVPNISLRILKLSVFHFITTFVWGGALFLLPALIRLDNLKWMLPGRGCVDNVVHGSQFLILAGVMGVANMVGKPLGYIFRNIFPFKVLQPVLSLIVILSYTFLLIRNDIVIFSVLIGIGKLSFAIQEIELGIITYDVEYYGTLHLAVGSAVVVSCSFFGGVVGTSLAAFMNPTIVIVVTIVLGLIQVFVIFSVEPPPREVKIKCFTS